MKRKITKVLALLLMLSMLIPQTALAATYYYIELGISGPGVDGANTALKVESGRLGSLEDNLPATVVGLIKANEGVINEKYAGMGLSEIFNTGITAFEGTNPNRTWEQYVEDYFASVEGDSAIKAALSDKTSKFSALEVDRVNALRFDHAIYDPALDALDPNQVGTWTVTVTLRSYPTGGGSSGNQPAEDKPAVEQPPENVNVKPSDEGNIDTSTKKASPDEKVIINVTPDEGYVVNRVIVTDSKGNQIVLTADDNNTYSFNMPATAVDVQATFIREPVATSKTKVDTMLNTSKNIAYLQGKADGLFHPEQSITRGQVATIFYRLLKDTDVEVTKTFADVPDGFWCEDAVNTLAALGIVKGMNDREFAPNKPITRAQFVAICARFAQAISKGETFKDVPESYWAYDYITTASGYGWINGIGNGLFAPDRPITRAQAAAIVNRMLSRIADRAVIDNGTQQYDDVPRTYWAWYDISEASRGVLPR